MMFKGSQDSVPPVVFAFVTLCLAISIGAVWEVFEFVMDQLFGLNMQKSGLVDTVWDLIVNLVGGSFGSAAGFAYLKGRRDGGWSVPSVSSSSSTSGAEHLSSDEF